MPDIKDWLVAACGTLGSGEVIKPMTLPYLDAMNALEMMDPAMDVGTVFAPTGAFDPHAELSPEQVVWIMDEMAAREVAWLRGWTMAQTLFTSLHFHNAEYLRQVGGLAASEPYFAHAETSGLALRAFVLVYAKGVEIVYNALCDANGPARDGEDVWLDPYGIPIETTEDSKQVLMFVAQIILWLESKGDAWAGVIMRLRFRCAWIDNLLLIPSEPQARAGFVLSTASVPWAFDNVTPFLRQNMPYPAVIMPTHAETWDVLHGTIAQIQDVHRVAQLDLPQKEMFLCSRVNGMLPIVRCLYKTVLCDTPPLDAMIDQWLSTATKRMPGVLPRVAAEITGQDYTRFSLWRDIVGGTFHLTLAAPLTNLARRRRSYLHLAEAWQKQTMTASTIQPLAAIVPALRARALDCALMGHLLGFPLQLFARGEARAAWWATLVLARQRPRSGWEGELAWAWAAVASAMMILYTLATPKNEPTRAQFILRHKILFWAVGVSPRTWDEARTALDSVAPSDAQRMLVAARDWLETAQTAFTRLPTEFERAMIVQDVGANIAVLADMIAMGRDVPVAFAAASGASGTVPLLATTVAATQEAAPGTK